MIKMKTYKIPDFPKIKIGNYIYKLSDKIRIILEEDVISKRINDDLLEHISFRLGYSMCSLKKYVKMKKYPLFFIKELNNIASEDIFYLIEKNNPIFFSKWKFVNLPKFITPKLAYFVGYLQGDGCIESNKRRIDFTDEYLGQIERIKQIAVDLFNVTGRIEGKTTQISKKLVYRLEIGSLVLNSYLHSVFEINRGVKTDLKIPYLFKENKDILKWYLIGLFDADGTLPKNPEKCKQLFIDVTFKDKDFIKEIQKALRLFGVKTLNPYCRVAKSPTSDYISKTWELRIRKKEDMAKFLKEIGFSHTDKRQRLQRFLAHLGQ